MYFIKRIGIEIIMHVLQLVILELCDKSKKKK